MKPKPIDLEKVYEVLMKEEDNEFTKVVKVKDIKSAVRGLLQEIELTDLEYIVYSDGKQKRMSEKERKQIIIDLIKKWFVDVVEWYF